MVNDGFGVFFWLAVFALVLQIMELQMLHSGDRSSAMGLGFVRTVLITVVAISAFACWVNHGSTLVSLEEVEVRLITCYRAQQAVVAAQSELQKLQPNVSKPTGSTPVGADAIHTKE